MVHQNLFVLMGGVSHQESELFCSKTQLRDAAKSPPLNCLNSDPSLLTKIHAYWWRSKPPENWATALPQVLNLYIEKIHVYDTIVTYTSNKSQFGMIQVKPIHFKRIAVIKLTGSKASLSPNSNEEPDKSNTSAPISEKQPMRKTLHYCSTIKEDKLSELS